MNGIDQRLSRGKTRKPRAREAFVSPEGNYQLAPGSAKQYSKLLTAVIFISSLWQYKNNKYDEYLFRLNELSTAHSRHEIMQRFSFAYNYATSNLTNIQSALVN